MVTGIRKGRRKVDAGTKRDIEVGLKAMREGRYKTHEQLRKELKF